VCICANAALCNRYQDGETLLNMTSFHPNIRGVFHALTSISVPLNDMHMMLVDTMSGTETNSTLPSLLKAAASQPFEARVRLLMLTTDAWFGPSRLYSVMMIGCMASSLKTSFNDIDLDKLALFVPLVSDLIKTVVGRIAPEFINIIQQATYLVAGHILNFAQISEVVKRSYVRAGVEVSDTSLKFTTSYWLNILGHYNRMRVGEDLIAPLIVRHIHLFMDELVDIWRLHSVHARLLACDGVRFVDVASNDEMQLQLQRRIQAYFGIFSAVWGNYVDTAYVISQACAEERRKRPLADDDSRPSKKSRTT